MKAALALLVLLATSCTTSQYLLPVAGPLETRGVTILRKDVYASSCYPLLWNGPGAEALDETIAKALRKVPGANVLVDVSVTTRWYPFRYVLIDGTCLYVWGDAARVRVAGY